MSEPRPVPAETIAVRAAHRFDVPRLEDYLKGRLEGFDGALSVRQMASGQSNPTFLLQAKGREWVLRKKPPGKLLPSAHAVDREHRVQKALAGSGVPVPRMHLYCESADVIGTAFYVMERKIGRVFEDNAIPGVSAEDRAQMYDSMNHVMARLHTIDWQALGLADFGRPGNFFARQFSRWTRQWHAAKQRDIPEIDRLIEWLPKRIPDEDASAVIHGDYRTGNLMFDPVRPEVIAVFDWELSTIGHPLVDLGHNCMPWHTAPDEFNGLLGLDLQALGVPKEDEYIARYCERTGRAMVDLRFQVAFSLFRMASVFEGILARAVAGNASNERAREVGALSPVFARRAWAVASGADAVA